MSLLTRKLNASVLQTDGCSGAEIAAMCQDAALLTMQRDMDALFVGHAGLYYLHNVFTTPLISGGKGRLCGCRTQRTQTDYTRHDTPLHGVARTEWLA